MNYEDYERTIQLTYIFFSLSLLENTYFQESRLELGISN